MRCTSVRPSIPGCGETQGDAGAEDFSASIGEFLGDEDEDALETLEIEDAEDLPPDLDFADEDDLSTLSSISLVWFARICVGEPDLFEEPVLSVWVGLETFLLVGEPSIFEKLLDKLRGETRGSDDRLEEEELEQLPDRLGTAPLRASPSIRFGDLGGELVGGGGLSAIGDVSMEFCGSGPRGQQPSVVIVMVVDVDDVVMHVAIVPVEVEVAHALFSLRRFRSSMFCEVISIVALRSRKKSSSTDEGASKLRDCFSRFWGRGSQLAASFRRSRSSCRFLSLRTSTLWGDSRSLRCS